MIELSERIKQGLEQEFTQVFIVKEKNYLTSKNGDNYITLKLTNKDGMIEGKIWKDNYQLHNLFKEGDIVKVRAGVNYYKDDWQLIIKNIEKIDDDSLREELLPQTKKDINLLIKDLNLLINGIEDQEIKQLLLNIFNEEFILKFKKAPAAKGMHHAYMGGLLEHTISVAKIAKNISKFYKPINVDVLVASALLHDIGKVDEIDHLSFNYTDEGKLLGHITIGTIIIKEKTKELNFSKDKETQILHCILSHHGQLEWGSPSIPQTKEAMLLHLCDLLDSRMNPLQDLDTSDKGWTDSIKLFNRSFKVFNIPEETDSSKED